MQADIHPATKAVAGVLRVTEIFLSLQGETRSVGLPTVFVRLTGCPLRCGYCDTAYAFHGGERMGIEEPVTGPPAPPSAGSLFAFLFFSTGGYGGHLQVAQHEGRPDYFTCELTRRDDPQADPVELHLPDRAPIAITFSDDRSPRRFRTARFSGRLADGSAVEIETTALGCAVDMQGLGYGGYDDARGLGVWRGDSHLEHDVWDVSHPSDVVRASGTVRPIHRIQPVRVVMRGGGLDGEGTGSLTLIAEGRLPQLGLG